MTKNHNYYLDLAYQLAEKNLGKTGLNPSVGAIVVKDDSGGDGGGGTQEGKATQNSLAHVSYFMKTIIQF